VGNTDAETMRSFDYTTAGLDKLLCVSVRDERSKNVLYECGCTQPIEILLDPTFLKTKEQYLKDRNESKKKSGYVALYCFQGALDNSGECSSCFSEFAAQKGLKLVSGGVWSDYAENVHCEAPCTFDYYADADYVIANTFHGTAFALIYEKPFVVFDRYSNSSANSKNSRIQSVCDNLGVTNRRYRDGMVLADMLAQAIDYVSVGKKIEGYRSQTIKYLQDAFGCVPCRNMMD
jgi:hypothetical protein